jgi:type IV secretion system protein TrbI
MPDAPTQLKLRPPPPSAARLNRRAGIAVAIFGGAALLLIIVFIARRGHPAVDSGLAQPDRLRSALAAADGITSKRPDSLPSDIETAPAPIVINTPPAAPAPPHATIPQAAPAAAPQRSQADRDRDEAIEEKRRSEAAARTAGAGAEDFGAGKAAIGGIVPPAVTPPRTPDIDEGTAAALKQLADAAGRRPADDQDQNRQRDKQGFIAAAQQKANPAYLEHVRTPPISPLELKTGTLIPAVLVSSLNSDLPGEIIAQVTENVYDSATGNRLLVPQGAKLFGKYDSAVTYGQQGLIAVWQRIVFPDSSTLELDGMQGYDTGGNAGFRDEVDDHFGRILAGALLSSVLAAGTQVSQLQQQNTNGTGTSVNATNQVTQAAGAALGQNISQVGSEIIRRGYSVQPTILVRTGYLFNIISNKDIVFPSEYED